VSAAAKNPAVQMRFFPEFVMPKLVSESASAESTEAPE
jgi:hypothetical protein